MSEPYNNGRRPSPSYAHPSYPGRQDGAEDGREGVANSLNVRALIGILRRHLWLALAVAAATMGIVAYVVYTEEPLYRANAVIRLADTRQALTGGLVDRTAEGRDQLKTDLLLSQIQVLMSRNVAGEVVDNSDPLGLKVHAHGFPSDLLQGVRVRGTTTVDTLRLRFDPQGVTVRSARAQKRVAYGTPVEMSGVRFAVRQAPAVEEGMLVTVSRNAAIAGLLGNLNANARLNTDVIDVTYTAHDPHVAQRVVNTVVEVFRNLNGQRAQEQSRRRQVFIEEQLKQNDTLLVEAQRALNPYLNQRQAISSREKSAAEQAGLMGLAVRREELDADRKVYQSLLSALQQGRKATRHEGLRTLVSAPGMSSNPVVSQLYSQLVQYETARDSLTTGAWAAAATHPDVKRLDALVAATEQRLVDAVQSYITTIDARIAALDDIKARNTVSTRSGGVQAEEARLSEQVATLTKMSDQLREEYQKARIAAAVEGGQVEIVDLAALPGNPVGIGRSRKLIFGLLLGLFMGGGAAVLVDFFTRLSTAIRRRDEIESVLQIAGLGVIPAFDPKTVRAMRAGKKGSNGNGRRNGKGAGGGAGSGADGLVTVSDMRSPSSEAYRTLRTNLIFSRSVKQLNTIVVTSAAPSDGKSTTASNLAVTFAQQGLRVLLVDCDLRKARLHNVFRVPREPGLTQLVAEHREPAELIRSTPVEGLFLLTAGKLPPNPSELLGSAQMRVVVEVLANQFDIVIFDTPPVLVAADAAILGSMVDGVLMVLRAGQTERDAAREALRQLSVVGVWVVGAVLNDPDSKVPREAGYYQYSYYGETT